MSLEVMPYTSARMYMQQKNVPDKLEEKSEVLVPMLDGVMPEQTATASAR